MRTKTLSGLAILAILAGTLAGCGPKETPTEEAPPEPATPLEVWGADIRSQYEGTQLSVAVASHPSIDAFKKMTADFEELTGIDVVWDEMEEGALADKLLLDGSAGKTSFDVIMNCPEFTPILVDLGMLEPLDSWIADSAKSPDWFDYEDVMAAYRDMLSYEGKHYGIPFAGETVFLFYRSDLFDKYDKEVPTTFDEVMETAAFFHGKEEGLSGISMRTRLGWECTYMWSVFIFPFGGVMLDPETGEPGFDRPGTIDSLEYMIEVLEYAPPGIESYSFPEAWDAFMQGKAAIMIESSAAAPEVENTDKSVVAGKVAYAPMPAGPAGAYSGVWGWGLSMTLGSEKKDAAWAFITYMTSKEMQDEYLANGGIVSRASMLNDPAQQSTNPYYQATLDTLKQASDLQAKGLGVVIMMPAWSMMSEVMGTEAARAIAGEITAQEACESMQAQITELLSQ